MKCTFCIVIDVRQTQCTVHPATLLSLTCWCCCIVLIVTYFDSLYVVNSDTPTFFRDGSCHCICICCSRNDIFNAVIYNYTIFVMDDCFHQLFNHSTDATLLTSISMVDDDDILMHFGGL